MSAVDTLNVATRDYIDRNAKTLIDGVFQSSKLAQMLREKARKYPGGTQITEHLVYAGSGGGAHKKGKTYVNAERQTDQRLQFDPKFMQVPVVLDQIDIRVINQGPFKVYDILEAKLSNAYLTLGAYMEIAMYLPGTGHASFSANIDGLAQIVNDGSANSWDGATYATYGELSRTDGNPWNTAVKGKISASVGALTYELLESSYTSVKYGGIEPTLGQTTPKCVSFIKNKFQTQQRFNEVQEPKLGFNGLKFNRATIVDSRYCPGSENSGTTDPICTDYATFTSEDDTTTVTAYPTVTGETFFWLNTDDAYLHLYISTDKIWGMGFSDFIPSATSDMLVGRVRNCWALTAPGPRYHYQMTGITS